MEIINILSALLESNGNVTKEYAQAVNQRELNYPTGLPTQGVKIAIPHADAEYVIQPGIALAVLEKTVAFGSMENPDENLDVGVVIMLANRDSGEQIKNLQHLTELFANESLLLRVHQSRNPKDIADMLNRA